MSVRPLFLCIASLAAAFVSACAAADGPLHYRYWMVPAEKISRSPWGDEKYYPVRMERLERWLDSLRRVSAEPSGALAEIRLEASLVDGALSEGEGEVRFKDKCPPACELTPCSMALSQLRWKDGSPARVVSDGTRPVTAYDISPEKVLLFAWSLAPESDERNRRVFHFELPPAPAASLRLHLPANLTPAADPGLVTRLEDEGVWLIEPGPGGDFRLTLSENEVLPASNSVSSVAEQIFCRVSLEGIELVYTARFTGIDELSDPITLRLDEPFLPEKVEWESAGPADAVWEKDGQTQKIILPAPRSDTRQSERLTLTAFAPFDSVRTLCLPPVHSSAAIWQETELAVSFDPPTAPENFIFRDSGRSGSGGLLRLFKRTGEVEIPLVCVEEKNRFESATRITVTGGDLRFETDLFVTASLPGIRRLTIPIRPGWRPESVSVGGVPIPFRLEAADGPAGAESETAGGQTVPAAAETAPGEPPAAAHGLTLALDEPISPDQPLWVRLAGRRSLNDPTPLLSDYEPLVIDEPVVGAHLLALATDTPSKISLVDGRQSPLSPPGVPEDLVRRLFGSIPDGTVFSLVDSAPDTGVRIEKDPMAYAAEISGRAAIFAGSVWEEWNFHCTPPAGSRVDRVLVTFNTKDAVPWRIAMTQSGNDEAELRMRPATESEQAQYNLSDGQTLGEILLSAPRSAPFTIRLVRDRQAALSDGVVIPLPALCAASSQTGRIDISTPDFTPARLEVRSLIPITPPPAEKGAAASALASYRYTPSEKGGYTLAARESGEDRRSGWCRYLRLESDYAATGTVRTRALCRIENTGIPSLLIEFPEQISLVNAGSVRSGKDPIPYMFHPEERKLEIPLPVQRRDFTLSFEYETRIVPFGFKGNIPRQVPRLNIPVLEGDWTASIPTEYRPDARRGADLTRVPLDAPVKEYRLISRYRLRILQLFIFLVSLALGLRFKAVHMAFLTLPTALLYAVTSSEVCAQASLGILAASVITAVFNFFYHRKTGEPMPDLPEPDTSEIGFVTRGAAVLLLLFGASAAAADENYSIFVPARNGERAADEPVWIPEELQNRLAQWERENADPETAAQFESALYEGQLNYNRETGQYSLFHLTAKYRILTAGANSRIDLPAMPIFQEGGILIDGVAGSVTMRRDGPRIRLELRGIPAGVHQLEFSLLTDPFEEKDQDGLFVPLPAVPDAKLLLRLPNDAAAPRLSGAMGQVSTSPGILTADLGQTSGITFLPPEKGSVRGETVMESEQEFRLAVSDSRVLLRGEFRLHLAGRCSGVTLLADPRYRLLRCTSPDADLIPAPIDDTGQRISVALRQPVSGTLTLRADFVPRDFSGVGELPLPAIRVDDAVITSSRLLMPPGSYPAEYDLTDPDSATRSIPFVPPTAEPKISESAAYRFSLRDTTVTYHAALRTESPLWQLTLRVPQKHIIESFEITDSRKEPVPLRKSEKESLLHVFLDEPLTGAYQVDLRLRAVTQDRFPLTGILDAPAEETELSFECAPSLYCDFTPPGDWTGLPAGSGGRRWALPAAAASIDPPVIRVMSNRPKVTLAADIFYYPLAESPDRLWELRADCLVRVEAGQVDRLEFEIDESFRSDSIRTDPALFKIGIERSSGGGRRLLLTPNEPLREETRFILHAATSNALVRLPRFDLAGAAETKIQIRLPRAVGDQPFLWQTQNLEVCVPEQIGNAAQQRIQHLPFTPTGYFPHEVTELSHIPFNMFQTYRPSAPGSYSASVSAENTVLRLNRAETEYRVRSDGTYWGRASYDLNLGAGGICDLQVPSSIRLLHAEAAGVPLAPIRSPGEEIVRLRIISESSFVHLELLFASATKRESSFRVRHHLYRDSLLTAPVPVGAGSAPSFWTVRFENGARPLPYYVSQEGKSPDLRSIRKSFPPLRSAAPLPESGNWKRPVSAERASAFRTRLDVEKLSYLLSLIESVDSKEPVSSGSVAGWLDAWRPLYHRAEEFFSARQRPPLDQTQIDAFYSGSENDPAIAALTQSSGAEEFRKISQRWEDLSRRLDPNAVQAENAGTASAAAPETADAPSEPMPDDSADLLLFGAADQVRDILLLIPTSSNISFAPFRTLLSIFALLAAAAILVGGWFSRSIGEGTDPHRHEAGRSGTPEEETASRIESAKTDGSGPAADTEPETNARADDGASAASGGNGAAVLLETPPDGASGEEGARVETVKDMVIEESEMPPSAAVSREETDGITGAEQEERLPENED